MTIRCTQCSSEFNEEQTQDVDCCPSCGSTGVPCDTADDVVLNINWHELRILTIWASNFAQSGVSDDAKKTLMAIIRRLEKQYPEQAPLTLMGELKQLQETYPSLEAFDNAGNTILPKKKLQ